MVPHRRSSRRSLPLWRKTVAIPKSEILSTSPSERSRFSGLTSRCATPRLCRYSWKKNYIISYGMAYKKE